jgi:ankyrin repeat protein
MSGLIQESIDRKRQEAIKTGVSLMKLLTPSEADFLREQRRQAVNASARRSYARNRGKEISDQIRKQRTPEGKAAKLYFNTLARARRWGDKELESALLDEKAQKGKAALVDVPAIMLRLGRGRKWRLKPVQPIQPKQPRKKCPSKWSQLTRETIFELTKGGETALHRAIKLGKLNEVPREAFSLEIFLAQNDLGRTPLHYAAHFGGLNLIPREYLTKETLSVRNTGGNTPVHIAAQHDHLDEIPAELLTSDLMSMENNSLATPETILEWNARPASEKQKAFLADLGATFDPSTISVSQASRLIRETMPVVPATRLQIEKLKRLGCTDPPGEMTAEAASSLIEEIEMRPATKEQLAQAQELGLILKNPRKISAGSLDAVLKLVDRPISDEQWEALEGYGISSIDCAHTAFNAFFVIAFAQTCAQSYRVVRQDITEVCSIAVNDPDFWKPVLVATYMLFSSSATVKWPKEKLRQWAAACNRPAQANEMPTVLPIIPASSFSDTVSESDSDTAIIRKLREGIRRQLNFPGASELKVRVFRGANGKFELSVSGPDDLVDIAQGILGL